MITVQNCIVTLTLIIVKLWAILCPSTKNLLFFYKTLTGLVLDPVTLKLDPLPADMLSSCCFCSFKHQSSCAGYLSILLAFQGRLNLHVSFSLIFCSFFIPPLLHIPPLITEVENTSGDLGLFPMTFLPKYLTSNLTGCVSHCCIVGGNHAICGYVIIPQIDG